MGIPQLQSCCCGCSLKTGTQIIGWLQLICSIIVVVSFSMGLAALYYIEDHPSPETEKIRDLIPLLKFLTIASIIMYLIGTALALVLLLGIYQNKPHLVYIWVAVFLALAVIEVLVTISQIIFTFDQSHPLNILGFLLNCYFILVVYSYYREIQNVPTNYA